MAVVQMACLADAMSCVRDMHGAQFKSKILEVKYMVCILLHLVVKTVLVFRTIYFYI